MIKKITSYFKNKKEEKVTDEYVNRLVAYVEFAFTTMYNEKFTTSEWIGIGKIKDGIKSANRLMMHESSIYVNGVTYSTKEIYKVEPRIIKYGIVKKEFKKKNDYGIISRWNMMWRFDESVIEEPKFNETMIETFNRMFL